MPKLAAVLLSCILIVAPAPAGADPVPVPICRDSPVAPVNDYYNPYAALELHGLERCAGFVSYIGVSQYFRLQPTNAVVNATYPPGGVFFLWAPETQQYGDGTFVWQGKGFFTMPEARMCILDVRPPGPYGVPPVNFRHRLDLRYGNYNQPAQATVVAWLINPQAAGR